MRLSIAGKLITLIVAAVALASAVVLLVAIRLLEPPLEASIETLTHQGKTAASAVYNANSEKFLREARLIAQNPDLIEAVVRRDHAAAAAIGKKLMDMAGSEFIAITDEKGMVVARGHSLKYGDDLSSQETVRAGLQGKSTVGLVPGALIPFTLRAGAPLMRDGKVAGTVGIGISLTSEAYVDRLKRETGLEVTIFNGDVRAMTTLMQDGKRMIGTRLSNAAVSEAVLQRGETVFSRLELLGKPFNAVYWPILNAGGKPVGMQFVGQSLAPMVKVRQEALRNALLATTGITLVFALAAFIMGRLLASPVKRITAYAETVADGNLDASLSVRARDEIGRLAGALHVMVKTLKTRLVEVGEQSELARRETAKAQEAMNMAEEARHRAESARSEGMLAAAGRLEGMVGVVSSVAAGLAAQIGKSERGAAEQAVRVTETATAMEEMNATVAEVARNAGSASEMSAATRQRAEAGAQVVSQAVDSIRRVEKQSLELKDGMRTLSEQAQSIDRIMGVISDIADQTNLLALNAAIEAARAGEAGRGFAVVADEVRKLAEKTMASTTDVGNAILTIQQSAGQSADQVEETVRIIGEATELANKSGEALQQIVEMADSTADQVRAIATASEQQSASSEEINNSITQVNAIAGDTSRAMREAAGAVAELADQARALTGLIDNMKKG
ncbi:methyl-accepting chemotaxis protein [uncultured Desulfovibrio sp.]|mgnify:CR=1 FL=1|uniref:methyl-accepting chemotaxis protein n=1 Tax=uncultured Desulfovibrio sp. TaxID=167968 RepID=UPI0026184755|nr:methyl-accepting chemotaxis protein [uncultured Desulfovibrio sp.]